MVDEPPEAAHPRGVHRLSVSDVHKVVVPLVRQFVKLLPALVLLLLQHLAHVLDQERPRLRVFFGEESKTLLAGPFHVQRRVLLQLEAPVGAPRAVRAVNLRALLEEIPVDAAVPARHHLIFTAPANHRLVVVVLVPFPVRVQALGHLPPDGRAPRLFLLRRRLGLRGSRSRGLVLRDHRIDDVVRELLRPRTGGVLGVRIVLAGPSRLVVQRIGQFPWDSPPFMAAVATHPRRVVMMMVWVWVWVWVWVHHHDDAEAVGEVVWGRGAFDFAGTDLKPRARFPRAASSLPRPESTLDTRHVRLRVFGLWGGWGGCEPFFLST